MCRDVSRRLCTKGGAWRSCRPTSAYPFGRTAYAAPLVESDDGPWWRSCSVSRSSAFFISPAAQRFDHVRGVSSDGTPIAVGAPEFPLMARAGAWLAPRQPRRGAAERRRDLSETVGRPAVGEAVHHASTVRRCPGPDGRRARPDPDRASHGRCARPRSLRCVRDRGHPHKSQESREGGSEGCPRGATRRPGVANRTTENERTRCRAAAGAVASTRAPARAGRRKPIGLTRRRVQDGTSTPRLSHARASSFLNAWRRQYCRRRSVAHLRILAARPLGAEATHDATSSAP